MGRVGPLIPALFKGQLYMGSKISRDLGNIFPKGKDQSKRKRRCIWDQIEKRSTLVLCQYHCDVDEIYDAMNLSSSYAEVHEVFQTKLYLASLPWLKLPPHLRCSFPPHPLEGELLIFWDVPLWGLSWPPILTPGSFKLHTPFCHYWAFSIGLP